MPFESTTQWHLAPSGCCVTIISIYFHNVCSTSDRHSDSLASAPHAPAPAPEDLQSTSCGGSWKEPGETRWHYQTLNTSAAHRQLARSGAESQGGRVFGLKHRSRHFQEAPVLQAKTGTWGPKERVHVPRYIFYNHGLHIFVSGLCHICQKSQLNCLNPQGVVGEIQGQGLFQAGSLSGVT